MTELRLSEIKGLLPDKKDLTLSSMQSLDTYRNDTIDYIASKNLLDYVEAVVCLMCDGTGSVIGTSDSVHICLSCMGNGAVIRVKEGK